MNTHFTAAQPLAAADDPNSVAVTAVTHWTPSLFSFQLERPSHFRFRSGEFAMIGLIQPDGRPLLRAYSMASPSWDDQLEFYSIIIPDGPLTSRLCHIAAGDHLYLRAKTTGTLVLDTITPGKRLFLLSTGTGFAPFASIIRDPQTYELFDQVIITHTCRNHADLGFSQHILDAATNHPLIGEMIAPRLTYYPSLTRENFRHQGRITSTLKSGKLFEDLNIPALDPANDRVMICGSMGLNKDVSAFLQMRGFVEGGHNTPASYVVERAFVG
ncbi:ferredoxin--NADP reductase [Alphaproteobacteria bacterium]|nr:ferredoxin--NADP reductase [Alphaproteobacteria bacterium]